MNEAEKQELDRMRREQRVIEAINALGMAARSELAENVLFNPFYVPNNYTERVRVIVAKGGHGLSEAQKCSLFVFLQSTAHLWFEVKRGV